MPVPLTEGKAFHVPCVVGAVVSGITVGRGAAVTVADPDFNEIAIATRAGNRIVAREVAAIQVCWTALNADDAARIDCFVIYLTKR